MHPTQERARSGLTDDITTTTMTTTERPGQVEVWGTAVAVYRLDRVPYGDSPQGLLRFMGERRG